MKTISTCICWIGNLCSHINFTSDQGQILENSSVKLTLVLIDFTVCANFIFSLTELKNFKQTFKT